AQHFDAPAVDLVAGVEQPVVLLDPVDCADQPVRLGDQTFDRRRRHAVLGPVRGEHLRVALAPRAYALRVVLAALEDRRAGQRRDVTRTADVVRMHVRHHDRLDRRVECVEHRPPLRLRVAGAEARVDEDEAAVRRAQEVAVHVVDPERQREGDAKDPGLELVHVQKVDERRRRSGAAAALGPNQRALEKMCPKGFQDPLAPPDHFSRICWSIGNRSVGVVTILTPGYRNGLTQFMWVMAFISPARVRFGPACLSACTIVHALATPKRLSLSTGFAPASYFARIALYSFAVAEFGWLIVSATYVAEMSPSRSAPCCAARPMKSGDAETLLMNVVCGCHPIPVITASASIVCVGSEKSATTFAPAACSLTICALTSVAVESYFSTSTIFDFESPRPCRNPL